LNTPPCCGKYSVEDLFPARININIKKISEYVIANKLRKTMSIPRSLLLGSSLIYEAMCTLEIIR
jgi:hypothetical protein